METARVDIRKLQLLNDRISQTIDALNQVRLSVHGLAQSPSSPLGIPPVGYPGQSAMGAGYGAYQQPYQQPYYQPFGGTPAGMAQGLSHTGGVGAFGLPGPYYQHFGAVPGMVPGLMQPGGYGASPFGLSGMYQQYPQQFGGIPGVAQGLSHTGSLGASPFGYPGSYQQLQGAAGLQNPWLAQSLMPVGLVAGQIPQAGLAHTSPEYFEAGLGTRQAFAAVFPFANWAYSPFVSA